MCRIIYNFSFIITIHIGIWDNPKFSIKNLCFGLYSPEYCHAFSDRRRVLD
jgi:hypothetical protein